MKKLSAIGPKDKRPLYVQAISALTTMLENGDLSVGSQLPSESELADMLSISRSTLREALGHLETYGMVIRKQGKGTFVSMPQGQGFLGGLERLEPFRHVAEKAHKDHRVEDRRVSLGVTNPEVAAELEINQESEFNLVQVMESIDGVPCMYLEDYLIAENLPADEMTDFTGSMLTYLIEKRDPSLTFSNTKLFAVNASPQVAAKLNIKVGEPVLHLKETYYDATGKVLGVGYLYQVTDHFYYYVTRRVMPA